MLMLQGCFEKPSLFEFEKVLQVYWFQSKSILRYIIISQIKVFTMSSYNMSDPYQIFVTRSEIKILL